MCGSRWALIILGVFLVSTLGCLPTPSVREEIPSLTEWYGQARMVYIPFSGLLRDPVSAGFSSQNGFRFDPLTVHIIVLRFRNFSRLY